MSNATSRLGIQLGLSVMCGNWEILYKLPQFLSLLWWTLLTIPGAALLVLGCVTYPDTAPRSCPPALARRKCCVMSPPRRRLPMTFPSSSLWSPSPCRSSESPSWDFFSLSTFFNLKSVFSAAHRHLPFKLLQSFQTQYFQNKIYHFYIKILSIQCLHALKGSSWWRWQVWFWFQHSISYIHSATN